MLTYALSFIKNFVNNFLVRIIAFARIYLSQVIFDIMSNPNVNRSCFIYIRF